VTVERARPIQVTIVEDDEALREGLGFLIDSTPGYQCGRTYGSVEDALRLIGVEGEAAPDVMLLDINLPGMPGSEGVRLFRQKHPAMQVLMLSVYAEQRKVFESICNGACGYLLKTMRPEKVLEAVREVHEGGSPMSPEIARQVVTLFQRTGPPEKLDERLKPAELRLIKLLAEGYGYQTAAKELAISVNTVRNYIRSIYDKLHVHSKSEAVSKAIRSGLI
jgi:DNA-binding NarL/FixJ family response regulator